MEGKCVDVVGMCRRERELTSRMNEVCMLSILLHSLPILEMKCSMHNDLSISDASMATVDKNLAVTKVPEMWGSVFRFLVGRGKAELRC